MIACGCVWLCTAGCGHKPSAEELGTVVYEIPMVPGAEKPYQLPPEAGPVPPSPEREWLP